MGEEMTIDRGRGRGVIRETQVAARIGVGAAALLLATALTTAVHAQVNHSPPVIYDDKLVEGLPGPDALYDADQGQPQALLPEPQDVVFPSFTLPAEAERLAFRKLLYDQYGLTYAFSCQQLSQYATQTLPRVTQDWAVGGWAAAGVTWTPLDRGGDYEGSLVVRGGWRGPPGRNPWPAPFGPAFLGSAWSIYEFTSWNANFKIAVLETEHRTELQLPNRQPGSSNDNQHVPLQGRPHQL
jgi:hypothetical protein